MSKVGATYSNKPRSPRHDRPRPERQTREIPGVERIKAKASSKWMPFAVAGSITLMLCLTVNFRAFTELRQETLQHEILSQEIETLTNENLTLQEEIHYLKSDSKTIEREARKLGLGRSEKDVPVPAN